jgi:hypothetical protein
MGGGQTKALSHFAEIRKQLIWGNKFILFKNKSLMFDNWFSFIDKYLNHVFIPIGFKKFILIYSL